MLIGCQGGVVTVLVRGFPSGRAKGGGLDPVRYDAIGDIPKPGEPIASSQELFFWGVWFGLVCSVQTVIQSDEFQKSEFPVY